MFIGEGERLSITKTIKDRLDLHCESNDVTEIQAHASKTILHFPILSLVARYPPEGLNTFTIRAWSKVQL